MKKVQSIAKALMSFVKQTYPQGHTDKIKCKYVHQMAGLKSRQNFENNKLKASSELKLSKLWNPESIEYTVGNN